MPLIQECFQALVDTIRSDSAIAPFVATVAHSIMRRMVQLNADSLSCGSSPFWEQLSTTLAVGLNDNLSGDITPLLYHVLNICEHLVRAKETNVRGPALAAQCGIFVILSAAGDVDILKHANGLWSALMSCAGDSDVGIARTALNGIRVAVLACPKAVSRSTAKNAWSILQRILNTKLKLVIQGSTAQQLIEMTSLMLRASVALAPFNAHITTEISRTCASVLSNELLQSVAYDTLMTLAKADADAVWFALYPIHAADIDIRPMGWSSQQKPHIISDIERSLLNDVEKIEVEW